MYLIGTIRFAVYGRFRPVQSHPYKIASGDSDQEYLVDDENDPPYLTYCCEPVYGREERNECCRFSHGRLVRQFGYSLVSKRQPNPAFDALLVRTDITW